jgi:hypothetical protein
MEQMIIEEPRIEHLVAIADETQVCELNDFQLALIGGGIGDCIGA